MEQRLANVRCDAPVLDACFYSPVGDNADTASRHTLCTGLVNGVVEVWSVSKAMSAAAAASASKDASGSAASTSAYEKMLSLERHTGSVRCVAFDCQVANRLCSGSLDKSIAISDIAADGREVWSCKDAHDAGLNCMRSLSSNVLATGDEAGGVKLWDVRQKKCATQLDEHSDIVYSISDYKQSGDAHRTMFTTSGDGTLAVHELRKNGNCTFKRASDDQEDELLSLQVIKGGKKVIVGTQEGILDVWSWGTWGDISDRVPGHPSSIDCMVKVDEETLLTGSSDGFIRVVNFFPHKLLYWFGGSDSGENGTGGNASVATGDDEGFPIERMSLSHDRTILATVSHDDDIALWGVDFLFNDNGGDDDDDDDDDDARDTDDEDDDDDDDDGGVRRGNKKRRS